MRLENTVRLLLVSSSWYSSRSVWLEFPIIPREFIFVDGFVFANVQFGGMLSVGYEQVVNYEWRIGYVSQRDGHDVNNVRLLLARRVQEMSGFVASCPAGVPDFPSETHLPIQSFRCPWSIRLHAKCRL